MLARRKSLHHVKVQTCTHAGLWLDKFLKYQTEDGTNDEQTKKARADLIIDLGKIAVPEGYRQAFSRRQQLFDTLKKENLAEVWTASVEGRMIIGLGQKGPVEAGLALEHTWGIPMIPGSALKGLTMAAAHLLLNDEDQEWRKGADERGRSLALLGGTTEHIGSVIFHDAWWKPEGERLPIHPDVMTVHHADYYTNGEVSPSDMDNPNPIPFASVTGKYQVVVEKISPDVKDELLDAALCILKLGLEHLGIGAKTNAGYGRMSLAYDSPALRQQREADEAAAHAEQHRREQEAARKKAEQQMQLAQRDAQSQVRNVGIQSAAQKVPSLLALFVDDESRRAFAQQLVAELTKKVVLAKAKESKPWAVELVKAAGIAV
jgi:CRISPR-associated protein Cmr6